MYGYECDPALRNLRHCSFHRFADVVELQIQENAFATVNQAFETKSIPAAA